MGEGNSNKEQKGEELHLGRSTHGGWRHTIHDVQEKKYNEKCIFCSWASSDRADSMIRNPFCDHLPLGNKGSKMEVSF